MIAPPDRFARGVLMSAEEQRDAEARRLLLAWTTARTRLALVSLGDSLGPAAEHLTGKLLPVWTHRGRPCP